MLLSHALPESLRHCRAVQVLERSLQQNRLGHGILLHGDSLGSLELIVQAIAKALLNCKGDPYEHPDCFTLRPAGKARIIKVGKSDEENTMRRLVVDLQKSSNQGGRKVGILFEADRMNTASANAFLKTLEEPSSDTTLFLLTCRPYDLLDTIRSRCLNFRIPAEMDSIAHPEWSAWTQAYHAWLTQIIQGPNKQTIPHITLGAYGLNARFQKILDDITDEAWKTQKEKLPEHITAEEKDAMEAGMSRGYRKQLYGEIEKETLRYARALEQANPGCLPVPAVGRVIDTLEKSARLLELNFNQTAALELFFLQSMRIWAAAQT